MSAKVDVNEDEKVHSARAKKLSDVTCLGRSSSRRMEAARAHAVCGAVVVVVAQRIREELKEQCGSQKVTHQPTRARH